MRCPSADRLVAAFRDLDRKQANRIRRICKSVDARTSDDNPHLGHRSALATLIEKECPETHAYARSCYSDPYNSHMWRVTLALHAIDCILGTYGVEGLGTGSMYDGPPYEYCNTGDTYATTLVYTRATDTLRLASWGVIAEHDPQLRSADD